ncbi:unnamed protein product [Microthlaspi erraticum]|uniref:Transposase MuDR plant domain-containing protein n=1 Tax=Microthlaspi erraticum TaxID=1685480 RepID=A0A6D2KFS2_9BRAS|nr:unnamed protein product [Microthlaspi erraticum]
MAEHCMVISGEWRSLPDGKWDFVIDKQRMSQVVAFEDGMSIDELKKNVIREFIADGGSEIDVELSYWPPNTHELATGITTPPVIVTSGASISYFCKHFRVKNSMNLFANFGKRVISTSLPVGKGFSDGYTTPMPTTKRARFTEDLGGEGMFGLGIDNLDEFGSSVGSRKFPVEIDDELVASHMENVENIMRSGDHTKEDLFNLNTTYEKSVHDSLDELKSDVSGIQHDSDDLNTDEEDNGQDSWDDYDVRPLGIDEEFWEPLVDEVYGGSDAPDFMCPDEDPPINAGPSLYTCSTNDAFDHTVIAGGDGGVWKNEAPSGASTASGCSDPDYSGNDSMNADSGGQPQTPRGTFNHPSSRKNVYSHGGNAQGPDRTRKHSFGQKNMDSNGGNGQGSDCPRNQSFGQKSMDSNGGNAQGSDGPRNQSFGQKSMDRNGGPKPWSSDFVRENVYKGRSLTDIDDEEFDIPPMYDDLLYDTTDIPDLDIDEIGGEVAVGKVFSSKKDCQVALAIYAIKNMFNFRQTTTKRNYFVLNCTDQRCEWRILAGQVKHCG